MRTVVAVPADTHGGAKKALMPPELWRLGDGDGYDPTYTQKEIIWPQWMECWDKVKAARRRSRLIVVHNGDAIEGLDRKTEDPVSPRLSEHRRIHIASMDWALKHVKGQDAPLYYVQGTRFHVGKCADDEEEIARDFGAVPAIEPTMEHDGRFTWPILRLNVNGIELRFAHHGPRPGMRPHTHENSLYNELKGMYWKYMERGEKPPRVCVWSHYHTFAHATFERNGVQIDGFITPAFAALGPFGTKIGKGLWWPDIGMLYLIVEKDGSLEWDCPRLTYDPAPLVEA